jgi:hypothetical protein
MTSLCSAKAPRVADQTRRSGPKVTAKNSDSLRPAPSIAGVVDRQREPRFPHLTRPMPAGRLGEPSQTAAAAARGILMIGARP